MLVVRPFHSNPAYSSGKKITYILRAPDKAGLLLLFRGDLTLLPDSSCIESQGKSDIFFE
jgi:hypothetical protein